MKLILKALIIFCTLSVFAQSKTDSLLLTQTEWINKNLDYLRFNVDTVTYNLADKRHDLFFDLGKRKIAFEERYFRGGTSLKKERVNFQIKSLTKEKLILEPLDDKMSLDQEGFLRLDYQPFFKRDKFVFYNRKNVVEPVDFKKITFLATTCFGTCPSFSLEINRDGQIFYQGRLYTGKFKGNFIGMLDKKERLKLHKLLNRSQISKIATDWKQTSKSTDNPRYNYIIELKNGEVLEISTNDQHPILDRLSEYLKNIPEVAELQKTSKVHSYEKPKVSAYAIVGIGVED